MFSAKKPLEKGKRAEARPVNVYWSQTRIVVVVVVSQMVAVVVYWKRLKVGWLAAATLFERLFEYEMENIYIFSI